jgi:AcrR family transcriptional regulator
MSVEQKVSRERILEGAESILGSGHYSDLTVDALARSLRMSKSTLYKYFPSKEDVVVALIREACEQAESDLQRALDGADASSQLEELAGALGRHGERLPRAVLVESEKLPPACNARLRQTRDAFSAGASVVVDRGVKSGEFRADDPRVAAVAFVAAAEAVLADGARRGIEYYGQRVTQITTLFLPGLRNHHN